MPSSRNHQGAAGFEKIGVPPTMELTTEDDLYQDEQVEEEADPSSTHHEDVTASNSSSSGNTNDNNISKRLGKEESTRVFQLRLLVILAIVLAAIAVSLAVYFLTANAEKEEFQQQYEGASTKVLTSFEDIVSHKLSAIGGLAIQASLHAKNTQANWPNVTIPDYGLRAGVVMELSGAMYSQLAPIVTNQTRTEWEEYSIQNTWWLEEAAAYDKSRGLNFGAARQRQRQRQRQLFDFSDGGNAGIDFSSGIPNKIFTFGPQGPMPVPDDGPYFPSWQVSYSFGAGSTVNFDSKYYGAYYPYLNQVLKTGEMTLGGLDTAPSGYPDSPDLSTAYYATLVSIKEGKLVEYQGDPMSTVFVPVFDDFQATASNRTVVAVILSIFKWAYYFEGLLPTNFPGLVMVLQNSCNASFTYKVVGEEVEFLGEGDLAAAYTNRLDMRRDMDFDAAMNMDEDNSVLGVKLNQDLCAYKLSVYPSKELEQEYLTYLPILVTGAVALVFVVTGLVFYLFNHFVERRQTVVMDQAVKTTQIVDSLFPEGVRQRLMDADFASGKTRLKSFLDYDSEFEQMNDRSSQQEQRLASTLAQPIADLFPNCTVFFSDISGFTAWSSTRNPTHVFTLLESIYQSFDGIAKRYGVFKVETVGDSYVAVTGLPNPNDRHALVMARFAGACIDRFGALTRCLEHSLGPDTADLGLRIGMHSGPVTAGVLRGERCRFQLFGDCVNTASRMESTGEPNRIQVSSTTAKLLIAAGKEHWVHRREDALHVRGKGILESYWITPTSRDSSSTGGRDHLQSSIRHKRPSGGILTLSAVSKHAGSDPKVKHARLVAWMVELFKKRIATIMARQDPHKVGKCPPSDLVYHVPQGQTSLDEVAEVIKLPSFDAESAARAKSRGEVDIDPEIEAQLKEIVTKIAEMYQDNPFHNFEHACHVTMAVDKFMSRIVTPDMDENLTAGRDHTGIAAHVHSFSHGINSDPITLFAIVFSAFIHDTDHRGVSNAQLAKEDEMMAELYKQKSIAEQNSLDLAWELLCKDCYAELRAALFVNREEMMRFRQVVVNMVLATDIFDKELNDLRKGRWNRAFSEESEQDELHNDLRATIVVEHIIQAADVSHTMQHWHIYRKWNERLFTEMYKAFREGRMGKCPSEFWYKGELGFFDNYIIPLAKKLKECNVFGVSSDECLNYSMQNRLEWESKGLEITASMLRTVEEEFLGTTTNHDSATSLDTTTPANDNHNVEEC